MSIFEAEGRDLDKPGAIKGGFLEGNGALTGPKIERVGETGMRVTVNGAVWMPVRSGT